MAPDRLAGVRIFADSVQLEVFENLPVEAGRVDAGGRKIGGGVTWAIVDAAIATVSDEGVVTGRAVGETFLVAEAGGFADSARMRVTAPPVGSLVLAEDSILIGEQGRRRLVPAALDAQGRVIPGMPVTFRSSAPSVFTVEASGEVVGISPGEGALTVIAGEASANLPVRVEPGYAQITLAAWHACAIRVNAAAYCWGSHGSGALGVGPTPNSRLDSPGAVVGDHRFTSLALGENFTCGVTTDGRAFCWGTNSFGNLGTRDFESSCSTSAGHHCSESPVEVAGGHRFSDLGAGEEHACAIDLDGAVWCWGYNRVGQLGVDSVPDCDGLCSFEPVAVQGNRHFQQVALGGFDHTCALDSAGDAYCWGASTLVGTAAADTACTDRRCKAPLAVDGGFSFQEIRAGYVHTCGRTGGASVLCWGRNAPFAEPISGPPAGLASLGPANLAFRACGITAEGEGYCWDIEGGVARPQATPLPGGIPLKAVASGLREVCGISVENVAYCWDGEDLAGAEPVLLPRPAPVR